jgi:hypothetical protein
MRLIFGIQDLPPMPRNRSHRIAGKMLIKTGLARAFEEDLTKRLLDQEENMMLFRTAFKPNLHFVKAGIYIFTPKSELFTKQGAISARAVDFDAHKLFVDVIFRSLGMDDKLIRDARVMTPVSEDDKWNYVVDLQLLELQKLATFEERLEGVTEADLL